MYPALSTVELGLFELSPYGPYVGGWSVPCELCGAEPTAVHVNLQLEVGYEQPQVIRLFQKTADWYSQRMVQHYSNLLFDACIRNTLICLTVTIENT